MPDEIIITLPVPPRFANPNKFSRDKMANHAAKKKYRRAAYLETIRSGGMGQCWDAAVASATLYYGRSPSTGKLVRRRDSDNILASLKAAFDAMTQPRTIMRGRLRGTVTDGAGLLVDDGPDHLLVMPPEQLPCDPGQEPCVMIVVRRVDSIDDIRSKIVNAARS